MATAPADIDAYLAGLPDAARPHVAAVLDAVRAAVPGAEERIRYGMPALMLDTRRALHVGGWKRHAGLYPVSTLPEPLESEVAHHRGTKDSLHFRYTEPVPAELITRVAAAVRSRYLA